MAADMKQMIADAVRTLLIDKNKKRITVKDIVEECNITRQAFYYHFADIPELLQWIASQKAEDLRKMLSTDLTPEERIKSWFLMYLNVREEVEKSVKSNYGEEIKEIMVSQIFRTFHEIVDDAHVEIDDFEKELLIRYHGCAILGMLSSWTEEDTKNIDRIAHDICLILEGKVSEL